MKTNFKVGDKVWDDIHYRGQEGKVIGDKGEFLAIKFKDNISPVQYFPDGRIALTGKVPTLSKVPYTFKLPEQPLEFEEGDPVLVRDFDTDTWAAARFVGPVDHDTHKYKAIVYNAATRWRQCIPFEMDKMGRV